MDKKLTLRRAATALAATLAAAPAAHAADNPFALVEYHGGMRLAADQGEKGCAATSEMKCGAGADMDKADAGQGNAQAQAKDDAAQAGEGSKATTSSSTTN